VEEPQVAPTTTKKETQRDKYCIFRGTAQTCSVWGGFLLKKKGRLWLTSLIVHNPLRRMGDASDEASRAALFGGAASRVRDSPNPFQAAASPTSGTPVSTPAAAPVPAPAPIATEEEEHAALLAGAKKKRIAVEEAVVPAGSDMGSGVMDEAGVRAPS
jgi:hypothetical protein